MRLSSRSHRLFLGMRRGLVCGKRRPTAIHRHSADGSARISAVAIQNQLLYIPAVDTSPELNHRPSIPTHCSRSFEIPLGRAVTPRGPSFRARNQSPSHCSLPPLLGTPPHETRDPFPLQNLSLLLPECMTCTRPRLEAQPSKIRCPTFQNSTPMVRSPNASLYVPFSPSAVRCPAHEQAARRVPALRQSRRQSQRSPQEEA